MCARLEEERVEAKEIQSIKILWKGLKFWVFNLPRTVQTVETPELRTWFSNFVEVTWANRALLAEIEENTERGELGNHFNN